MRATHGSCDDGPVVKALETDGSVVLYASVAGERSGPCPAVMTEQSVKAELEAARRPHAPGRLHRPAGAVRRTQRAITQLVLAA